MKLNPYLAFGGNCREAFDFYVQALGAKSEGVMTWGEGPMADQIATEYKDKVMHGSILLGEDRIMACDRPPGDDPYEGIKGVNVVINVDSPEDAERKFAALAEGGRITMPIEETFWAQRFGMLVDRFGVPWMVNCDKPEST